MSIEEFFLDAYKKLCITYGKEPSEKQVREEIIKTNGDKTPVSYTALYRLSKKHSLPFAKMTGNREDLSKKALELYNEYEKEYGKPPTGKIIGYAMNISSVYVHQLLNDAGIFKKKCTHQLVDSAYKEFVAEHNEAPSVQKLSKKIGLPVQTVNGFLLRNDLKKKYKFRKEENGKDGERDSMRKFIKEKYNEFIAKNKRPPSESELATECKCTHSKVKYSISTLGLECSDGHKFKREKVDKIGVNGQFWNKAVLVFSRSLHPSPYGAVKTKQGYVLKQISTGSIRMKESEFNQHYMSLKERMTLPCAEWACQCDKCRKEE